jgi:signal transduction histidine kinase
MDDARRALFNLRAVRLEARSLGDALTAMVATMTSGLPVSGIVEVRGTPRPLTDHTREHHLLRIAQEALTNALRHSGARTITVILEYTRGTILLTVRDDGRGSGEFPAGPSPEASYGLRGMRERADAIGAKLTVSTPPSGFEVAVELKA